MEKMKVYPLILSRVFPRYHKKGGMRTYFAEKFLLKGFSDVVGSWKKYHTIRANYDLWAKRFEKIAAGEAVLSVREWVGKPYAKGSSQRELLRLTRDDGIGIQKLSFLNRSTAWVDFPENGLSVDLKELAAYDGLSLEDWCDWFRSYDVAGPMAIIHFTSFRY